MSSKSYQLWLLKSETKTFDKQFAKILLLVHKTKVGFIQVITKAFVMDASKCHSQKKKKKKKKSKKKKKKKTFTATYLENQSRLFN